MVRLGTLLSDIEMPATPGHPAIEYNEKDDITYVHPELAGDFGADLSMYVRCIQQKVTEREEKHKKAATDTEAMWGTGDVALEFLNYISHHIRTPLAGIAGYATMISDDSLPDAAFENTMLDALRQGMSRLPGLPPEVLVMRPLDELHALAEGRFSEVDPALCHYYGGQHMAISDERLLQHMDRELFEKLGTEDLHQLGQVVLGMDLDDLEPQVQNRFMYKLARQIQSEGVDSLPTEIVNRMKSVARHQLEMKRHFPAGESEAWASIIEDGMERDSHETYMLANMRHHYNLLGSTPASVGRLHMALDYAEAMAPLALAEFADDPHLNPDVFRGIIGKIREQVKGVAKAYPAFEAAVCQNNAAFAARADERQSRAG